MQRRQTAIVSFCFFLGMLVAGVLLGAESSLALHRNAAGAVRAVNAWRFGGFVTVLSHSVDNLREVRIERMSLSESAAGPARITMYSADRTRRSTQCSLATASFHIRMRMT